MHEIVGQPLIRQTIVTKILFSGCSYFKGTGLELEKQDSNNVVNIFSKTVFENNYELNNISDSGNSNDKIYFDTAQEMYNQHYDYVFVGITSYPRYNLYLGFDPWDFKRKITITPGFSFKDLPPVNGHTVSFSEKWLEDFRNKFLLVHHDHFETLDIIKYQNLLICQAHELGTKLFFVNNLAQWDTGYFEKLQDFMPSDLTPYTQKLLEVESRDDKNIKTLYNLMHNDYEKNSINSKYWINLYDSFRSKMVDFGNDNYHPGPISHKDFGLYLAEKFKSMIK